MTLTDTQWTHIWDVICRRRWFINERMMGAVDALRTAYWSERSEKQGFAQEVTNLKDALEDWRRINLDLQDQVAELIEQNNRQDSIINTLKTQLAEAQQDRAAAQLAADIQANDTTRFIRQLNEIEDILKAGK